MNANNDDKLVRAFEILIESCIWPSAEDNLAIVTDESFARFQGPLDRALARLDLNATHIFISRMDQLRMAERALEGEGTANILPEGIRGMLSETDALINALDGRKDTLDVRKAVLQHPRPARSRIAHVPGLTEDVLNLVADSPLDLIYDASERVAWALGEASSLKILTSDAGGKPLELTMNLDGWDNAPLMSPGKLLPGGWGNVAPGETFICPDHTTVNGRICIDGSVPGRILKPTDSIVLEFRDGALVYWHGSDESAARSFLDEQRDAAEARGDKNWRLFCELGIGLNPTIKALTGNPLFDEKMLETAHVAIGDNNIFGHPISARVHHDMVFHKPTIVTDSLTLMTDGILNCDQIDAARAAQSVTPVPLLASARVFLRKSRYAVTTAGEQDVLVRCDRSGGRVSFIRIGAEAIGHSLRLLEDKMETYGDVVLQNFIDAYSEFNSIDTKQLLAYLYHYRILAIARV